MSDCPQKGGCPTLLGLMVTVIIAIVAGAGLSSFANKAIPLRGVADQAVELVIVMGVILAAISGLRAFRGRGKSH